MNNQLRKFRPGDFVKIVGGMGGQEHMIGRAAHVISVDDPDCIMGRTVTVVPLFDDVDFRPADLKFIHHSEPRGWPHE